MPGSNLLVCQPFIHSEVSIFEKMRGNWCVPVKVRSLGIITNDMSCFAHVVHGEPVPIVDLPCRDIISRVGLHIANTCLARVAKESPILSGVGFL